MYIISQYLSIVLSLCAEKRLTFVPLENKIHPHTITTLALYSPPSGSAQLLETDIMSKS